MTVCYFGIYNPDYARNRVLIKGLRKNGIRVIECNVAAGSPLKYLKLFFRHRKIRKKYDLMIVGFPGQETMLLAKLVSRKKIIFDVFTSHYGGYILDRGYYSKNSLRAKYYRFIDKLSCNLADLVLLDTEEHIKFFVREYGLPEEKFKRIFVGTDESIFYPKRLKRDRGKFLIHFHGYFAPFYGTEYIVRAAKILEGKGIEFNLIGRGQTYDKIKALADNIGVRNVNFINPVPYKKLADYINKADVCLGVFGDALKTDLVISHKIYEAIACAKPVITASSQAAKELFKNKVNCLFCRKADEKDLAKKILILKSNKQLRRQIARGAWNLFIKNLTPEILGKELKDTLNSLVEH